MVGFLRHGGIVAVCAAAWAACAPAPAPPHALAQPAVKSQDPDRSTKPFIRGCAAMQLYEPWSALRLAVSTPDHLLLAHKTTGMFASADAGHHWQRLTPPGACHAPVDAFAANAAVSAALCVQAHNEASPFYMELYCSDAQGQFWRSLKVPALYEDFAAVPVADASQPHRMFGAMWSFGCPPVQQMPLMPPCETLAWSPDSGQSWQTVPQMHAAHVQLAVTSDTPPTLLVALSEPGPAFAALYACSMAWDCLPILKTGDACALGHLGRLDVNPFNGQQILFDWGDDGLWISPDRGRTCQKINDTQPLLDAPLFIAGVGRWGTLARLGWGEVGRFLQLSGDGGQTWQQSTAELPPDGGDLLPTGTGRLFYMGYETLYSSENTGQDWQMLPLPGQ